MDFGGKFSHESNDKRMPRLLNENSPKKIHAKCDFFIHEIVAYVRCVRILRFFCAFLAYEPFFDSQNSMKYELCSITMLNSHPGGYLEEISNFHWNWVGIPTPNAEVRWLATGIFFLIQKHHIWHTEVWFDILSTN